MYVYQIMFCFSVLSLNMQFNAAKALSVCTYVLWLTLEIVDLTYCFFPSCLFIQTLKVEPYHDSFLARYLIQRALRVSRAASSYSGSLCITLSSAIFCSGEYLCLK